MQPEPDLAGTPRAVHLVGIAGAGMSGLAVILRGMGHRVSGSDRDQGGHDARNLPADASVVVISAAVAADNPEVVEARHRGLPVWKYAEAAGRLMRGRRGVAVAGTHGKTTTTSILAWLLKASGLDPSFLIGGQVAQLGGSAGHGRGQAFVIEACEYDRSFWNYRPEVAVVTNIDADHLDCYKDIDDIEAAFRRFAEGAGRVIACADDLRAARLPRAETYGFSPSAAWRIEDVQAGPEGSRYRLSGMDLGTRLSGRHNVLNSAAAVVAALALGAPKDAVVSALGEFTGAARRLERLGESRGVEVFDDYGHHPREIACTLEALRQRRPGRSIRVVFQPHQYHRTRVFLAEFAQVLSSVEETVVPNIYAARGEEGTVTSADLVEAIHRAGGRASQADGLDAAARAVASRAGAGDILLVLGAGDIGTLAPRMLSFLT